MWRKIIHCFLINKTFTQILSMPSDFLHFITLNYFTGPLPAPVLPVSGNIQLRYATVTVFANLVHSPRQTVITGGSTAAGPDPSGPGKPTRKKENPYISVSIIKILSLSLFISSTSKKYGYEHSYPTQTRIITVTDERT